MIKKISFLLMVSVPNLIFAVSKITNPLGGSGIDSIADLFRVVLKAITYLAIPIIVLAFIYSGFKFIKAQGDSTGLSEAKKTFLVTLAGAFIILGSNVILEVVTTTAEKFMKFTS